MDSLSSLRSIDRGRLKMTDDANVVSSSVVSSKVQSIDESRLLEPIKDIIDKLHFS